MLRNITVALFAMGFCCGSAIMPQAEESSPVHVLPASASMPGCAPASTVMQTLDTGFGETPAWIGKEADGRDLILLKGDKEKPGSWTLLRLYKSNMACIIGTGMSEMPNF